MCAISGTCLRRLCTGRGKRDGLPLKLGVAEHPFLSRTIAREKEEGKKEYSPQNLFLGE